VLRDAQNSVRKSAVKLDLARAAQGEGVRAGAGSGGDEDVHRDELGLENDLDFGRLADLPRGSFRLPKGRATIQCWVNPIAAEGNDWQ